MTGEATVAEVLDRARTILERAGIPDPRLEARLLASHALGVSVETVMAYPERRVARKREAELEAVVARRAAREPLAHIVGHREFWSHRFCVTPHTLVPRPDSECMVDAVLRWLGATPSNIRILDLGTGTGCVLLSLLAEVPTAWGVGVDISMAALEVARGNALSLGLSDRAVFVRSDWANSLQGWFDVIVCNPPYIAAGEIADLQPEVGRFEPRLALCGGTDGLAAYRQVIPQLGRVLGPSGAAFFEIGAGAAAAVTRVMRDNGFEHIEIKDDFAGIPRCVRVGWTI